MSIQPRSCETKSPPTIASPNGARLTSKALVLALARETE